jgi:hypothetical protein
MPARLALLLLVVPLLGGCGGDDEGGESPSSLAPRYDLPSPARIAARNPADPRILRFRGVFPAIQSPWFVPPDKADFLQDADEVFGVELGGHAHAYPIHLLAFHHVVNDVLGGVPLLVTYCELCSSATAFRRTLDGRALEFESAGVFQATLVIEDRTKSLWLHLTGECVAGVYEGRVLEDVPTARVTTWHEWRESHPDSPVLRPEPGYEASYRDPALRQQGNDFVPEMVKGTLGTPDPRLRPEDVVYGLSLGTARRAYPLARVREKGGVVDDVVAGVPVTVWLDDQNVSVVGFERRHAGRTLTFRASADGAVVDEETGSTWSLDGLAVSGSLRGAALRPLHGAVVEWYGWSAHHPGTEIWP